MTCWSGLTNAWNSFKVNWDPLSLTNCSESQKLGNRLLSTSMVSKDVVDLIGMTSGLPLRWVLTITKYIEYSKETT